MNQRFNIEDLRKKKLIMNRESAKKSRLKKKKYIENLEKEFIILKEELIRLKSNQNSNNFDKYNNDLYSNKVIDNIIKNQNINVNLNNKEKEIFDLKKEEQYIIGNNLEKNEEELINKYIIKQKKVIPYLLVKQINIMTPNRIKAFENKFLKLQTFEVDDSIEVIKNKINSNLSTIIELYDIDENTKNNNICKKNTSMSYQLYDFYNNLKDYVNQYDILFNKINDI